MGRSTFTPHDEDHSPAEEPTAPESAPAGTEPAGTEPEGGDSDDA